MNVKIQGTFVMDGYHGFKDEATGNTLNEVLAQAFKKGTQVSLSVAAEYLDVVPLCHHKNKYKYECGEILGSEGNCPNAEGHWVAPVEADSVPIPPQIQALMKEEEEASV